MFGTCTIRAHYSDDTDTPTLEVLQADDLIQVDDALAEDKGIGRDGGRLTITGDVAYDLTDWTPFTDGERTGNTFVGTRVQP